MEFMDQQFIAQIFCQLLLVNFYKLITVNFLELLQRIKEVLYIQKI